MVIVRKAIEDEIQIKKVSNLLEVLGIDYKNISNYILAFIHRSIVNERPDFAPEHNERLEFLWDAVLELVITWNLFVNFPEKAEWELTDLRSAIVRWKNLAKIAKSLWFSEFYLSNLCRFMIWGSFKLHKQTYLFNCKRDSKQRKHKRIQNFDSRICSSKIWYNSNLWTYRWKVTRSRKSFYSWIIFQKWVKVNLKLK